MGRRRPWHTATALRLRRPAELGELRVIRGRIEGWGRRHDLPAGALVDLQLAVGEAVSNVMEHAYLGDARRHPTDPMVPVVEVDLELRFTSAGRAVVVRVTDHGRWRPPPADPGYRGRGMGLIAQLSDDLQVQRTDDGTQVRFVISLRR